MKSTLLLNLMALALVLPLVACGQSADHPPHEADEHGHDDSAAHGEATMRMPEEVAAAMEVATATAGPQTLRQTRELTGRVHTDPARVARVRPRYPGLITSVRAQPWDVVEDNAVLARVQSNDSLQTYSLRAPIGGWVVTRNAQEGEVSGDDPLFVIADLSELWVELDVFDHDLPFISVGQPAVIRGLHGERLADGPIDRMSPLAIHGAQSVRARVIVDNADGVLRPGQYVTAEVLTVERDVGLAVKREAVQYDAGQPVIFEKTGETYTARPVELGAQDSQYAEVRSGLAAGAKYVLRGSYLIKADLNKAGAEHSH
jgi:cobalt-zinc-cadmium efflux system membrane fusion protein